MEGGLRIETTIGFNGSGAELLRFVPGQPPAIVYAAGGLLVRDLLGNKSQAAAKVHAGKVTALALAPDCRLVLSDKTIVSGQELAYYGSELKAPVFLSDAQTLKRLHVFEGMTGSIISAKFSPDGKFLAVTDDTAKLNIWGMSDMKVVSSRVFEKKLTIFEWGPIEQNKRYPEYHIISSNNQTIDVHRLVYDIATMVYVVKYQCVQLPNTGLTRFYECNQVDRKTGYYYAGTSGGEICCFDINNKLFKASVQAGKSSLRSMLFNPISGSIYCGFSNGHLKELTGSLDKWTIKKEILLEGKYF
jgi:WD40 repeat protein